MCKIGWLLNIKETFSCTCQQSQRLMSKLSCRRFSLLFWRRQQCLPFSNVTWLRWSRVSDITPVTWQGQAVQEFFPGSECPLRWNDSGAGDLEDSKKQEVGWGGEKRRRKKKRRQRSATAPFQYHREEQQTLFGDLRGGQPQSLFQAADQGVDTWRTNQRISDSALRMMEQSNKTPPPSLTVPHICLTHLDAKQRGALWLLSNALTATTAACVRVTDALVKRGGRARGGESNSVSQNSGVALIYRRARNRCADLIFTETPSQTLCQHSGALVNCVCAACVSRRLTGGDLLLPQMASARITCHDNPFIPGAKYRPFCPNVPTGALWHHHHLLEVKSLQ